MIRSILVAMSVEEELRASRARVAGLERDNARLLEELSQLRQLADASRMASIAVLEALDLQEVLDTLLDCVAQLVPFDSACVLLLDEQGRAVMAAGVGYERPFRPGEVVLDLGLRTHLGQIVDGMTSVSIPDTRQHPGWQHGIPVSADTRSWLGVPLLARGKVLGLFGLDKRQPGFFTPDHLRLAQDLASHAALAIANARTFTALRKTPAV
jgi:GAF domain-containing protein